MVIDNEPQVTTEPLQQLPLRVRVHSTRNWSRGHFISGSSGREVTIRTIEAGQVFREPITLEDDEVLDHVVCGRVVAWIVTELGVKGIVQLEDGRFTDRGLDMLEAVAS